MIAMRCAQIAIEESPLWIAWIRRQSVNALVQLRECALHRLGFQRVLGREMGIEGAMRQAGGPHDVGDTSSMETALAKQPRSLPQNPVMLLGRLAGGIAHCFGL